jgi:hypothetical protein
METVAQQRAGAQRSGPSRALRTIAVLVSTSGGSPCGPGRQSRTPVCAENLDSDVLVMQPANQGIRHNASDPLNWARDRRILGQ